MKERNWNKPEIKKILKNVTNEKMKEEGKKVKKEN